MSAYAYQKAVSLVPAPLVIMKRSSPWELTAEMRLMPKRAPVLETIGVCPRFPQVVPL
jgi:hypothetical protein